MRKLWPLALLVLAIACSRDPQWKRREIKLQGDSDTGVGFELKAKNTIATQGGDRSPKLIIGCGDLASIHVVDTQLEIENGDVRIAFDESGPINQQWRPGTSKYLLLRPPKETENDFLAHLVNAKTFGVELTPKGGKPQFSTFNLRDIKDLMNQEKSCKSWLAQIHAN